MDNQLFHQKKNQGIGFQINKWIVVFPILIIISILTVIGIAEGIESISDIIQPKMEDNGWGIQYMGKDPYCDRWVTETFMEDNKTVTKHFRQYCSI